MMFSLTVAKIISQKLVNVSIFECQSEINKYPFMDCLIVKSMKKSCSNVKSLLKNKKLYFILHIF